MRAGLVTGNGSASIGLNGLLFLDRFSLCVGHLNVTLTGCLSDADVLGLVFLGHTHLRLAILGGDGDFRILAGAGGGFLREVLDVVGLVGDIADVHIDEVETHCPQLLANKHSYVFLESFAILVDLLDLHLGDHEAQLAEDDFAGQLLDVRLAHPEKTHGGGVHHRGIRIQRHGEGAGHIDADVVGRQRAAQVHLQLYGLKRHELVRLNDRNDESTTTVQSLGRLATCDLAVDDKDLVGGAFLIPGDPVGGGAN